jgi:hypothetical protein
MYNNQNRSVAEEEVLPTKKNARNILIVLDNMIRVIPDEKGEENFKSDLERQLTKAAYIAPENVHTVWRNVQNIITDRFNAHSDKSTLPQWCVSLLDIWTNNKTVP